MFGINSNKIKNKLIFIELNELNFDFVKKYLQKKNNYKSLRKIVDFSSKTSSEQNYHNIEPWIQWVTAHTGLSYEEHRVFHLGEIGDLEQIFEKVENLNKSVGCISSMNVANNLKNATYFIPDPWCETKSDESFWSKLFVDFFKQTVKDNAKRKITFKSYLSILLIFLRFVRLKKYKFFIKLIYMSLKKPWVKSLFLDSLTHEMHLSLVKKHKTDFSTIFFNASAYIMHRYLFSFKKLNSKFSNPDWYISPKHDPMYDILEVYDKIIEDYLSLKNYHLLLATGLRQVEYDSNKFYYRLKDHSLFLKEIKVNFKKIETRMSRDFKIFFSNSENCTSADNILSNLKIEKNNINLFKTSKISNKEIFVTLTYPKEITPSDYFIINNIKIYLFNKLTFIAIKNGMHDSIGYYYSSFENYAGKSTIDLKNIHNIILDFFNKAIS